jgi:hypothetical protein
VIILNVYINKFENFFVTFSLLLLHFAHLFVSLRCEIMRMDNLEANKDEYVCTDWVMSYTVKR